jgi:outer membrane receptor protein involved in Fe transport
LQSDVQLFGPISTILGVRVQDVAARTRATAGSSALPIESHDRTMVGAANLLYRVSPSVNLIATIARGFRSPNLVERFFDGPTPEGSGYQRSSPDLRPETSVAADVGLRVRRGSTALEVFVFRNTLHDGIRIAPTGDSVNRIPAFQNVNVDRLQFSGAEAELSTVVLSLLQLRGSYSRLTSRNVLDPINPIGHSYTSKAVGEATYRHPTGRFWLSYAVRHNGQQGEEQIGSSPVGPVLPAFTVRTARGGLTLFTRGGVRQSVTLSAENLGNVLYAESANVSFFRPQPGRRLIVSSALEF